MNTTSYKADVSLKSGKTLAIAFKIVQANKKEFTTHWIEDSDGLLIPEKVFPSGELKFSSDLPKIKSLDYTDSVYTFSQNAWDSLTSVVLTCVDSAYAHLVKIDSEKAQTFPTRFFRVEFTISHDGFMLVRKITALDSSATAHIVSHPVNTRFAFPENTPEKPSDTLTKAASVKK